MGGLFDVRLPMRLAGACLQRLKECERDAVAWLLIPKSELETNTPGGMALRSSNAGDTLSQHRCVVVLATHAGKRREAEVDETGTGGVKEGEDAEWASPTPVANHWSSSEIGRQHTQHRAVWEMGLITQAPCTILS